MTMPTKGRDLLRPALPKELPVHCTDGWSVSSTREVVPFPSLTQDVHCRFGGRAFGTMKKKFGTNNEEGDSHLVPPCSCFQGLSLHNLLFVQFSPSTEGIGKSDNCNIL